MVPVMVYILRMPMPVVVGTSLFQILFNCIRVTFLQAYTNHNVDFVLAVLLLLGSTIGARSRHCFRKESLKAGNSKVILAVIVLVVTVKIIFELTLTHPCFCRRQEDTNEKIQNSKFKIQNCGIPFTLLHCLLLLYCSSSLAEATINANHDHITIDFFIMAVR